MKNILEYLEQSAKKFPDKIAVTQPGREISYTELLYKSKSIGTGISMTIDVVKCPAALLIDDKITCLTAMLGTAYSGNFYAVIDTKMPPDRMKSVINKLRPEAIITDRENFNLAQSLYAGGDKPLPYSSDRIFLVNELETVHADQKILDEIRHDMIDTDLLYILFTSGSTGIPKGAAVSHRALIKYINMFISTLHINEETVFGCGTPLYFSMSVSDVFGTICTGATFHIIPQTCFSFPVKLIGYMNQKKVNTVYWVPSALCLMANWKALDVMPFEALKRVIFAGEVMPVKQLNYWISRMPKDTEFINIYGPTETVDTCTYYKVNRKFNDTDSLPIGIPYDNCGVLIITDDGREAQSGEEGELCVRGETLAAGYYNDFEKTAAVFTQNPLNTSYPETIYRTGDIVRRNEFGEINYLSRKDFQIKHLGYRIELGEIEAVMSAMNGMISCAAVYDQENSEIVLFCNTSDAGEPEIAEWASKKLLSYMIPGRIEILKEMPINQNGKIDRAKLCSKLEPPRPLRGRPSNGGEFT